MMRRGIEKYPRLWCQLRCLTSTVIAGAFLLPRCYVRHADPSTSEQIGFHLSRNSLWIARITNARVNNRVTRFHRRFPARLTGDRLGLTDRLIQSQTSVDARLCRFTFQLSDGGQSRVTRGTRWCTASSCTLTSWDASRCWFQYLIWIDTRGITSSSDLLGRDKRLHYLVLFNVTIAKYDIVFCRIIRNGGMIFLTDFHNYPASS